MHSERLQSEIERSPERGSNITLNFIFARHGEKVGEGYGAKLTKRGQEQATKLGQILDIPKDGIKIYYSDKIRARQTAEILIDEISLPQTQEKKIGDLKEKRIQKYKNS